MPKLDQYVWVWPLCCLSMIVASGGLKLGDAASVSTARRHVGGKKLFDDEVAKPLFKDLPDVLEYPVSGPDGDGGVCLLHYHKTGNRVTTDLTRILSSHLGWKTQALKNTTRTPFSKTVVSSSSFQEGLLAAESNTLVRVTNPGPNLDFTGGNRVIHWYRDPTSLILSGFRYHGNEVSAENWEHHVGTSPRIDESAGMAIFSLCEYKCSYFDLLQSIQESEGTEVEALMERQMLHAMQTNFQRWSSNPQVLHVSMEHLAIDFNATMRCILTFMGLETITISKLMTPLQEMNSSISDKSDPHITHGKYDNAELESYLLGHPSWGEQLSVARKLAVPVYARQRDMFGCPIV